MGLWSVADKDLVGLLGVRQQIYASGMRTHNLFLNPRRLVVAARYYKKDYKNEHGSPLQRELGGGEKRSIFSAKCSIVQLR